MRSIRISDEVWQEIAKRGKFGETEDDVLRRAFQLPDTLNIVRQNMSDTSTNEHSLVQRHGRIRRTFASKRMSSYIIRNQLHIEFQNGNTNLFELPDKGDKEKIRSVLNAAIRFAKDNGASLGQVNAVRKTLTSEGYHLTK